MVAAISTTPVWPTVCTHIEEEAAVEARWQQVCRLIEATPEDDWPAQWSVIGACICCVGPLKLSALAQTDPFTAPASEFMCSRCRE